MKCCCCKKDKSEEHFPWKNKVDRKKNTLCKECKSIYNKQHYKDNYKLYNDRRKEYVNQSRKLIFEYLKSNPCVDCGEKDPIVLEFDHVMGEKEFNIAEGPRLGYNCKKIQIEIAKCAVRCSNCHKRKTAKEYGWYSDLI